MKAKNTRNKVPESSLAEELIRKLSKVFDQTGDSTVITDRNGTIEYVNPAFEKCTGFSKEEAIGQTPRILKSGKHTQEFYKRLWDTVLSGKVFRTEFINKRKNGALYHQEETISPLMDDYGNVTHFVSTGRDVTEHRQMQRRLEEALNIKSTFVSSVSHELRTPLAAIQECIRIVQDQTAGPLNLEQKDFLNTAIENIERLTRLINSILDFQKLEAKTLEFHMSPNDINSAIGETERCFVPMAQEKGLKLLSDVEPNLPKINFDKDRIAQVLANLVSNALKFTEQGKITIRSRGGGDNMVRVTVEDTGIGIKPGDFDKLFQHFSQLPQGPNQQHSGTGLGLVISKQIITNHGGKMGVSSTPGKGSCFYFTLPIIERRVN